MNNIHVDFWGVRGSVPSPGPKTARYGGNTSCVSITYGNKILILDALNLYQIMQMNLQV